MADAASPADQLRAALERGWRPPTRPALIAVSSTEEVYARADVELFKRSSPAAETNWHDGEPGTVHLTSFRFVCQLAGQFTNIPYSSVVDSLCEPDGIYLWSQHQLPLKLQMVDPEWHYVLFRWLAYGEPRITGA